MVRSTEIDSLERETLAMIDATLGIIETGARHPAAQRARRALRRLRAIVSKPPRIAIAGEFNSGKSSLTNRLVEIDALPTDLLANTSVPTRLHWAAELTLTAVSTTRGRVTLDLAAPGLDQPLARIDVGAPGALLKVCEFIDMPGLADPDAERAGEGLSAVVPDALIWCTPTTQAWKETERAVWTRLPGRLRARTLLAMTFSDLVDDRGEIARVRTRMQREAGPFRDVCAVSVVAGHRDGLASLRTACIALANELKLDRLVRVTRLSEDILATLRS